LAVGFHVNNAIAAIAALTVTCCNYGNNINLPILMTYAPCTVMFYF